MQKQKAFSLAETINLFMLPPVALISLIRLSSSIYMFFAPLEGALLSIFLDIIDQHFVVYAKLSKKAYHCIDKLLDYQHYIFIVVFIIVYPLPITPVLLFLFIYRTIGHIAYLLTGNTKVFLLFTNLFELLFILYLAFERFHIELSVLDPKVLFASIVFKILHELYIHFFPLDFAYKFHAWYSQKDSLKSILPANNMTGIQTKNLSNKGM